jgi:hypothetical protein
MSVGVLLDCFLSDFRWYRKRKGGTWYNVILRPYPWVEMWVRQPLYFEKVARVEQY